MKSINAGVYYQPPRQRCAESGEARRVGYEVEFSGVELATVGEILTASLGGTLETASEAESFVDVEDLGRFKIELDWQFGKKLAEARVESLREETGEDNPDDPLMELLTDLAAQVVPVEVVCPPLAIKDLSRLDKMISNLHDAGAEGTRASPFYAFGVHINPELPDLSSPTVLAYLKAFCLAQDWLVKTHDVDLARRITPYVNLYPASYVDHVLECDSDISMTTLIDDYLDYNPTRNRALDMTPLFKHIDEQRLVSRLNDDRINARPTLHYRLPNCNIEQSDWRLSTSWNIWCVVEILASDENLLSELIAKRRSSAEPIVSFKEPKWHADLESIFQNLS